jgi:hypothetical protein
MGSADPRINDVVDQKGLGVLWVFYGILRLCVALWLATFTRVATVMFGVTLVSVRDSYSLMAAFHAFYLCAIILSALCGVIGLIAGLALISRQRWGPTLAVVAAFLSLSGVPFGLTLGIYTIWKLPPSRLAVLGRPS